MRPDTFGGNKTVYRVNSSDNRFMTEILKDSNSDSSSFLYFKVCDVSGNNRRRSYSVLLRNTENICSKSCFSFGSKKTTSFLPPIFYHRRQEGQQKAPRPGPEQIDFERRITMPRMRTAAGVFALIQEQDPDTRGNPALYTGADKDRESPCHTSRPKAVGGCGCADPIYSDRGECFPEKGYPNQGAPDP